MVNVNSFTGVKTQDPVAKLILDRVRHTIDAYGDYFQTLLKFHRFYLSANEKPRRPEPPDIDNSGREWRANIFVPYSFATIEAALPRLQFALFGQRPYVRMVGRELSDHERADQVTSLLDFDMERSEVDYKSILALKSFLKYGLTIGRVTYKHETYEESYTGVETKPQFDLYGEITGFTNREVTTTRVKKKFDGPWYEPVSVFNFFPDPLFYEIPEMRYVAELQITSLDHLHSQNEGHKALTGKGLYKNLDRLEGMGHSEALTRAGTWLGDSKEETAEIFGFGHGLNRGFSNVGSGGQFQQELKGDEVWVLHYWEPDRYSVLANGLEVIRDSDNPFDDEEVPYFAANCFPIEFEFYPQGMLHPVQALQEEANAWRSIAIDQGKINMMKPIAYDAEAGLTDLDFDIYPGSATAVKFESGKPLATALFPRDTLPPETWQMEAMLLRDWQNALGMNDYMIGGGPGQAGTASEAAMIQASAATRFKLQAFIGQKRFLERLARKMFSRRQQFLDEEEVFRILGRKGYEFPKIGPDDLNGIYDYMAMGSVSGPNKEVERQQLIQFVTTAAANPVMAQRLNWDEILEELVVKFDLPFAQRFILPPNKGTLDPEALKKILAMAVRMGDDNLADSVAQELQAQESMQGMMPGKQGGGLGPTQMSQGVAGTQGAGQIAASPSDATTTMPNLQAQAFGGPGV